MVTQKVMTKIQEAIEKDELVKQRADARAAREKRDKKEAERKEKEERGDLRAILNASCTDHSAITIQTNGPDLSKVAFDAPSSPKTRKRKVMKQVEVEEDIPDASQIK
jgi:hypothetical protein